MNRESYLASPPEVEVFTVKSGTDIIIRQNIDETEKEQPDGETHIAYECDEVQLRVSETVTAEEVSENRAYYLELAENGDIIAASDAVATEAGKPTVIERVEALEEAMLELLMEVTGDD